MKRIMVVKEKISASELRVVDAVGRGTVLVTSSNYNIGDHLLVVNDVIIGKSSKMDTRTYTV